jgi:glycosyltransferase involved in cell wall biosynthesis
MTSAKSMKHRLVVVALHPIQYQAGLWRSIARHPRVDVDVVYLDTVGIDGSIDPTLNAPMKWDMPLLEGYRHEFVRNFSPFRFTPIVNRVNPGLYRRLRAGQWDAMIVHGYLSISNWIALLAAVRSHTPVIYRGEGSMRGGDRFDRPGVNQIKRFLNARFLRACEAIAYSSEDNREYSISRGAPVERLFPMPCAVDNEQLMAMAAQARPRAEWRRLYGIPDTAQLVVTVGRFAEHKRVGDTIEGLASAPLRERHDVHLAIIGDGPLRADLERAAAASGVGDRIHFLGFLNQPAVVEAILASELFLLASSQGDPSPKALSEALCLGRAAVCSDGVGTCYDLIEPGRNGDVFPRCDPSALSRSVSAALADPAALAAMGERAREVGRANDFQVGVESLVRKLDELKGAVAR